MVRIKLCGLKREEDVLKALELGFDALGFILAPSPRKVSVKDVEKLTKGLFPFVSVVAVVADPDRALLEEIISSGLFDTVQFHGKEDPSLLGSVPLRVIKAFSFESKEPMDFDRYSEVADFFLLDSGKAGEGGTGRAFRWEAIDPQKVEKPFILAGGLGPSNVLEAIEKVNPCGVDLNSKLEVSPGVKDHRLMEKTIRLIRSHQLMNMEGRKDE